jgi:hypothetical protein
MFPYLCYRFGIFNRLVLKEYVYHVRGGGGGTLASIMDLHHDTSLRSILEDDFISLTSRTCICYCSGKRVGLWLVVRSFICLFHITCFIFTSTLRFCFCLI